MRPWPAPGSHDVLDRLARPAPALHRYLGQRDAGPLLVTGAGQHQHRPVDRLDRYGRPPHGRTVPGYCSRRLRRAGRQPALAQAGVTQARTGLVAGGNMEGKEVRFGPVLSARFAAASTGSGDGAVDSSHDSFTPLGGMVPLLLMKLGELSPGGPGAGLYGILLVAIQAVFVAGLMIGRTPEYLGKKIEFHDMRLVVLGVLIVPMVILTLSAISLNLAGPAAQHLQPGPHGMTEMLYAVTSATVNNGSAFAGLNSSTVHYNFLLAVAMWLGRFGVVLPVVALAGALAAKRRVAAGAGTLPTGTPLFGGLLVRFVVILGTLTFFPALALAPLLENLRLVAGHFYP